MMEFDDALDLGARIKVVGVGGAGGNAINTMVQQGFEGVEFIAANTDLQALAENLAHEPMQLGENLTKGLGAGANPEVGRNAALESQNTLFDVLEGAEMVFVTAGMGGGTGTGAAPIIASIARELGALTVGVVTKPFRFEGKRRRKQAEAGIAALKEAVDTLITIPNERLLHLAGEQMAMTDAFKMADAVLLNAVQSIADLITIHGIINVDFADVKAVMTNMGMALMGTGTASGPRRAFEAAEQAISSPLLDEVAIDGATGILINITGGEDLTLHEVNEAARLIEEAAHEDANIIFGSVISHEMRDTVKVTVIATGVEDPATANIQAAAAAAQVAHPSARGQQHLQRAVQPHVAQPSYAQPQPQAQPMGYAPVAQQAPQPAPSYVPTGAPVAAPPNRDIPTHIRQRREAAAAAASVAPQPQPVQKSLPEPAPVSRSSEQKAVSGSHGAVDQQNFQRPGSGRYRRSGLTPSEEEVMETPAFLRKPARSNNYYKD